MRNSRRLAVIALFGVSVLVFMAAGWMFWQKREPSAIASPNTTTSRNTEGIVTASTSVTHEVGEPSGTTAQFSAPRFTDVTGSTGVDFTFFRGETGDYWIPEVNGGGAAWIDFDGDGLPDLFLVNACQLPADPKDFRHVSHLFHNDGNGKFSDITEVAGVGHNGYGQGCGGGDYDNDGFDDLYVTCYGNNVLYHNHGDGTFSNVTEQARADSPLWSSSCAFGDLNQDGTLELYVCNYTDFDPKTMPICLDAETNQPTYCGPRKFGPLPHVLLLNEGDGRFRDIGRSGGTMIPLGKGLGVVIADLDNDRRPDVYVANDGEPNFLLHNRPAGEMPHFALDETAVEWGAAINAEGLSQASMGVACGDFDGDGLLDVAVTNFYLEYLTLYRNLGPAGFADVSSSAGITAVTRNRMGWGTGFIDYDNDGWLDLFATNGYLARGHIRIPDAVPPTLLRNTGRGRFQEVSNLAGPYFQSKWIGRGTAFGDYDNDGKMDIAVVHHYEPTAILHNETESSSHVLVLEFVGRQSNRNGVNVRVEAELAATATEPSPRKLIREVIGGGSYQSASDRRILLGLGPSDRVEKLTVRWPSGRVDAWQNVAADLRLLLIEGSDPRTVQIFPPTQK